MFEINFVGDIMLARGVGEYLSTQPYHSIISKEVKDILINADVCIGNLECPVAENAVLINPNGFKASPRLLPQIECIDILSLANNHIFDCGKEGAMETIEVLSQRGKVVFGLKLGECDYFVTKKYNGKKISFVGAVSHYCLTETSREYLLSIDSNVLLETIHECREKSDYVICYVHGGNEFSRYPEPSFRSKCKQLIIEGADLVVTNHPHIFGGVEFYNGKHIFYSLGDFIFDGEGSLRRSNIILNYHLNSLSYELDFARIRNNLQVSLSSSQEEQKLRSRFLFNSKVYRLTFYAKVYKVLYLSSFLNFQLDRIFFLIRKEGLGTTLVKTVSRLKYLPVLLKRYFLSK